jgi:hypothetical protein
MATFNKTNQFVADIGKAVHNFGTHQLKVALTNTAPIATNSILSDLTGVLATTNLSGATPFNVTTTSYTQTSGTASLVLVDLTLTATGAVGPWTYVVLYNDTPSSPNKPLIGWWVDPAGPINMVNTNTYLIDFAATTVTIT